jgi:hypothetical protein
MVGEKQTITPVVRAGRRDPVKLSFPRLGVRVILQRTRHEDLSPLSRPSEAEAAAAHRLDARADAE